MHVERAESWAHLQDLLFHDAWNEEIGRFRSPLAFRGLSDADYALDTKLIRLGGTLGELERHLLRNFVKYAHRAVFEEDSCWHWLSVAQHHGLPTRLLDWTYSPFVAMHFATANVDKFGRDGVVWCVNYERAHRLLPEWIRQALEEEGANSFTTDLLARTIPSLAEFDRLSDEPVLIFFEPPSMDDRIINQFALFSMMSSAQLGLDAWCEQHSELCRKILVPAALKWEIRDKLDQSNVTERVLFPGLDGLSQWLHRYYRPKRGIGPAADVP